MLKNAFLAGDNPFDLQLFAEGTASAAPQGGEPAPGTVPAATPAPAATPSATPSGGGSAQAAPGRFPTLKEFLEGAALPGEPGQNPPATPAPAASLAAQSVPGAPTTPPAGASQPTVSATQTAPATTATQTAPTTQVSEPRLIDQIPDKFKNPDGTVNTDALMKSYLGLEKVLGEQGGKLGRLERQLRELTALGQLQGQLQGQPGQPIPQPPATPPATVSAQEPPKFEDLFDTSKLSPEEKEKLNEQYYADPIGMTLKILGEKLPVALQRAINPAISQAIAPLAPVVEHYNTSQQATVFAAEIDRFIAGDPERGIPGHPDFHSLQPQMQALLERYGEEFFTSSGNPAEAVEILYTMAKGTIPPPEPPRPAPTLAEMLADQATKQQLIEALRGEILQGYVKEVKEGAPPVLLGGQPGGQPVVMAGEKPKSVREASRMFSAFLKNAP